jgi:hypothetical protein
MTTKLPGDLEVLDPKIPGEAEVLPSVASDAPILIEQACIEEATLQQDLKVKTIPSPAPAAAIPAHHLECCYKCLIHGSSVHDAARVSCIPVDVAQSIADEIVAVCAKLGSEAPVKIRPVVKDDPTPIVEEKIP